MFAVFTERQGPQKLEVGDPHAELISVTFVNIMCNGAQSLRIFVLSLDRPLSYQLVKQRSSVVRSR
jgi:hypothetical protein